MLNARPRASVGVRMYSTGSDGGDDEPRLSHVTADSTLPTMVDVGGKVATRRTAVAKSVISVPPELTALLDPQSRELVGAKGPVFATAVIAGTMAAKATSMLIPFCHPLPLDSVKFDIHMDEAACEIHIECSVSLTHKTGVEMEALTGASVAALAVYDMCKAVSHDIVIRDTRLVRKTGGKSDVGVSGGESEL